MTCCTSRKSLYQVSLILHIYISLSHTPQLVIVLHLWNSYWFWLDASVHFFFAFSTSFHSSGMPKNFGYFGHSFLRGACSPKDRFMICKGRSLLQGGERKFIILPASQQSPFWAILSQNILWKKNCRNPRQKVSKHYSCFSVLSSSYLSCSVLSGVSNKPLRSLLTYVHGFSMDSPHAHGKCRLLCLQLLWFVMMFVFLLCVIIPK